MGVPKFYRYISERYPCLSEVIDDCQIPEFDNLYLDMNGIIHCCSHPDDDDASFRISEEQIFADIFHYIDVLFRKVRPKKVFFMAVDGVAPRAKMNQQRARRFMSARTADEQIQKAKLRGEKLPDSKRFDSNCITPGTHFMTRLHDELSKWVEKKMRTDTLWQGLRVYLSGHNCPGEGEHKIMDFIRSERTNPDYNHNTRHCMYGLDADLLMLGLCSHEPHFSLLREEVKFNNRPRNDKKKDKKNSDPPKRANPNRTTFHLLHLSLLREYLGLEFQALKDILPFPFDVERIIDDWVLMGFLIGNDFIPHLPHVHIHDEALPLLHKTYIKVLPNLDGYINESGYLNLKRFEAFVKEVAHNDRQNFLQSMEDEEYMAMKRGKRLRAQQKKNGPGDPEAEAEHPELVPYEDFDNSDEEESDNPCCSSAEDSPKSEEAAFVSSDEEDEPEVPGSSSAFESHSVLNKMPLLDDPIEEEFNDALAMAEMINMDDKEFENNVDMCWSRAVGNSFKRFKRGYYKDKLNFENISKEQLREQCEGYVRAIQWVLHYYYHGCISWNWFFAHHYAPYISDIVDFSDMSFDFELSEPFKPFEQLLAVLPAASAECLPLPLQELMLSPESPIADFYPTDFETDLNGKKNDWEAVVLIPFIDQDRLLEAAKSKEKFLTEEEKKRNSFQGHTLFTSTVRADTSGIRRTVAVVTYIDKDDFRIPKEKVIWGLLPNVRLDVYFPGFPTMKHLPFTASLQKASVQVFHVPSRNYSMMLKLQETEQMKQDLEEIALSLLGKELCIDWPVLKVGRVECIYGSDFKFEFQNKYGERTPTVVQLSEDEKVESQKLLTLLKDRQKSRYGIDANIAKGYAMVRRFNGVAHVYDDNRCVLVPRKQFAPVEKAEPVLLPLLVPDLDWFSGKLTSEIKVTDAYPVNSKVFVLNSNWKALGYCGTVEGYLHKANLRVIVGGTFKSLELFSELASIRENPSKYSLQWLKTYAAARVCNVNYKLFSRLTGYIPLYMGDRATTDRSAAMPQKMNIGLNLKSPRRNKEVHNYTMKCPDDQYEYLYSNLCVRVVTEYRKKFMDLINFLQSNDSKDAIFISDIWPDKEKQKTSLNELREFLHALPTFNSPLESDNVEYADLNIIGHVERIVKKSAGVEEARYRCNVDPNVLFRPDLSDGKTWVDVEADYRILDRVSNVGLSQIPLGLQGTVVSIFKEGAEVLFDQELDEAIKKGDLRSCVRVPFAHLLNLTFMVQRKENKGTETANRSRASTWREQIFQRVGSGSSLHSHRNKALEQKAREEKQPVTRDVGPSESWVPRSKKHGGGAVAATCPSTSKSVKKFSVLQKPKDTSQIEVERALMSEQLGKILGLKPASTDEDEQSTKVTNIMKQLSNLPLPSVPTEKMTSLEELELQVTQSSSSGSVAPHFEELELSSTDPKTREIESSTKNESNVAASAENTEDEINKNGTYLSFRVPELDKTENDTCANAVPDPFNLRDVPPAPPLPANRGPALIPTSNKQTPQLTDFRPSSLGRGIRGRGRGRAMYSSTSSTAIIAPESQSAPVKDETVKTSELPRRSKKPRRGRLGVSFLSNNK